MKLNLSLLLNMIKCETATFTYKSLSCFVSFSLSNLLKEISALDININWGHVTVDVRVPRMNTCSGQRAMCFQAAKIRNIKLPLMSN